MSHTILIITFLLFAGLAGGCTWTEGNPAAEPKHHKATVAQAMQDYAYAHKAEFADKSKKELVESATEPTWNDVKIGFRKSYGELKDSLEKMRRWLSEKIES